MRAGSAIPGGFLQLRAEPLDIGLAPMFQRGPLDALQQPGAAPDPAGETPGGVSAGGFTRRFSAAAATR